MYLVVLMKIAVTGGTGFIGSHLSQALAEGNEVTAFDNLSAGDSNLPILKQSGIGVVKGDIRDLPLLKKTFEGVESVFHLAAMNRAMRSIENPLEANEVNVSGTLNVLEACRANDVEKVVFASSSSVYGGGQNENEESQKLLPLHPYGVGKLAGEEYCRVYNSLYGIKTTVLRYVSVYGPRQRGDIAYAAVIPKFIKAVLNNTPVEIYGSGKQTRQFTFVKDTVDATVKAWKSGKAYGEVFNIASPQESSVLDIALTIEKICGKKAELKFLKPIPGDPMSNKIGTAKAEKLLGFKASYSLEKGLRETVSSFKA